MNPAARSYRDDEALEETALRLIEAVGVESAIFICRSNYWHGILRLIMDRSAVDLDHMRRMKIGRVASLPRQRARTIDLPSASPPLDLAA